MASGSSSSRAGRSWSSPASTGSSTRPRAAPRSSPPCPSSSTPRTRMILDGEYVAKDGKGLFFFDVLQVDDRDLRPLPLTERKKILHEILAGQQRRGQVEAREDVRGDNGAQGPAHQAGRRGDHRQEPDLDLRAAQLVAQAEEVRHDRLLHHRIRGDPGDEEDGRPEVMVHRGL